MRPTRLAAPLPFLLLVVLLVLISGCTGPPAQEPPASLDVAPVLQDGDWWTHRIQAPMYGLDGEVTTVFADGHIGVAEGDLDMAMIFHMPPLGPVTADLGWVQHDAVNRLLDFPLRVGKTWPTTYWGADRTAEVMAIQGSEAVIDVDGVAVTYDARARTFTSIVHLGPAQLALRMDLIDHGEAHAGPVRVPQDITLTMYHGHQDVADYVAPPAQGGRSGSVDVPPGFDAMTFALILRPGTQDDGTADPHGGMGIRVTDPAGDEHAAEVPPMGPARMDLRHTDAPAGTWSYETDSVQATGASIAEAIAYAWRDG